jgi:RimJ/RimL family protein N-acetyltransferase
MSDPDALPFPDPPLHDELVVLRRYRPADAPAVAAACADPETQRWIPVMPSPYTLADAQGFIGRSPEAWATGAAAIFAIADPRDDALLGSITVHRPRERRAMVGYWVAPWARRRGVATAALRLVSRWALRELGIVRLALYTLVGNEASGAVAERCGFVREGILRNYDDDGDCVMFSLIPADIAAG